MHNTKNIIILTLILALSLCACTKEKENRPFAIQGVWILERIKNYDGQETKYNNENNSQWLRIYDDSCFYECKHPKTIIIHGKESCKENCNYRCNHVNHYG